MSAQTRRLRLAPWMLHSAPVRCVRFAQPALWKTLRAALAPLCMKPINRSSVPCALEHRGKGEEHAAGTVTESMTMRYGDYLLVLNKFQEPISGTFTVLAEPEVHTWASTQFKQHLQQQGVQYHILKHTRAYTATETAAEARVSGLKLAKTVRCSAVHGPWKLHLLRVKGSTQTEWHRLTGYSCCQKRQKCAGSRQRRRRTGAGSAARMRHARPRCALQACHRAQRPVKGGGNVQPGAGERLCGQVRQCRGRCGLRSLWLRADGAVELRRVLAPHAGCNMAMTYPADCSAIFAKPLHQLVAYVRVCTAVIAPHECRRHAPLWAPLRHAHLR